MHTLILFSIVLLAASTSKVMADVAALRTVAESARQFSTDFFKTVANDQPGNLITSPLSVEVVVSMAAYGAGGNTAVQMRSALHLPADDSVGRSGFQSLITTLNNVKNVTLRIANKVYTRTGFTMKREYKELTSRDFLSESEQVDFSKAQQAASLINTWCQQQTNNRITDILKPDDITPDTALVLLNAVYFKGNWAKKFEVANTKDRDFHVDENTVKKVPTMYMKAKFRYGELSDIKARFIELPYQGDELSMIIILPDEINGLKNVEANLQNVNMNRFSQEGYSREVELYLPKFKIESTIPLNDIMKKLGMTDMFTNAANFSGISNVPLAVSKVIQKAFIEVNEEGSEAAAVTGMVIMKRKRPTPCVMAIDRPFLSIILDRGTQTALFYSHVHTLN